jgi:hypothetical protein
MFINKIYKTLGAWVLCLCVGLCVMGNLQGRAHEHETNGETGSPEPTGVSFDGKMESQVARYTILTERLYLYQVLNDIKSLLLEQHDDLPDGQKAGEVKAFEGAISLIDGTIAALGSIVDAFNNGGLAYNPEIEYRFITMCNFLSDIPEVQPRHVRNYKEHIEKFNDYVQKYRVCRKDFLKPSDLELIDKITHLNHRIKTYILRDEFLGICFADKVLDSVVYRPLDFMSKHPIIVTASVLVVLAAVTYFYVYPWVKSWWLKNRNQEYDVVQFEGVTQGMGTGDCAYFATAHAAILAACSSELEVQEKISLLHQHPEIIDGWHQVINQERETLRSRGIAGVMRGTGDLQEEEVAFLLQPQNLNPLLTQLGVTDVQAVRDRIVVLSDINSIVSGQNVFDGLVNSVMALRRNNQAQIAILNTARANFDSQTHRVVGGGMHWVAMKTIPDAQARHGFKIWAVNSVPYNITAEPALDMAMAVYTQRPLMRPGMLGVAEPVENAHNVMEHNNNPSAALDHLTHATLQAIAGDVHGSYMNDEGFRTIRADMGSCFDYIRQASLAQNIHQAQIRGTARVINFDLCQNFDHFVQAVTH